jgi:hypothetical protein
MTSIILYVFSGMARLCAQLVQRNALLPLLRSSAPNAQIMNRVGVILAQNPGQKRDALPQPIVQQLIESRPYFDGRIERFGWRRKGGCSGQYRVQQKPSD